MDADRGDDQAGRWRSIHRKLQPHPDCLLVRETLLTPLQPDNLQRQYKKLMVKEGLRPPPGIVDADFKITISEDEELGGEDDDSE